ncbi:unnamed protein product [Camellia sinensis]
MALRQLVTGSPLWTLCLLIAGRLADVFSTDNMSGGSIPGAVNMSPQSAQYGTNFMLDNWEENLAVITANRTKDDELVLIHLGDCLWKERSENIAAYICYLVAEANFEPYSDSARLCLIGADHWKFPRTYASPDVIQVPLNCCCLRRCLSCLKRWKNINNNVFFFMHDSILKISLVVLVF